MRPTGKGAYLKKGRYYCRKRCMSPAGRAEKEASATPAVPGVPAFRHETVMAWLLDRVAQYSKDSGYHAFVGELVDGIREGEVEAAFQHGELDDILERLGA